MTFDLAVKVKNGSIQRPKASVRKHTLALWNTRKDKKKKTHQKSTIRYRCCTKNKKTNWELQDLRCKHWTTNNKKMYS